MNKIIIFMTFFVFTGCYTYSIKSAGKASEDKVSKIKIGESSKIDVERLLGKSSLITQGKNGEESWSYMETTGDVGLFTAKGATKMLIIVFGSDGLVKQVIRNQLSSQGGYGSSSGNLSNDNSNGNEK